MTEACIVGWAHSPFGKLEDAPDLETLMARVARAAIEDAGLAPEEIVWAAIDCPGFYAWCAADGRHGAMTGTMQAEVLERPRAGDRCIVLAWPIERPSERRNWTIPASSRNRFSIRAPRLFCG